MPADTAAPQSDDEGRPRTVRLFAVLGTLIQALVLVYLVYACAEMILRFQATAASGSGTIETRGELMGYIMATIALAGSLGIPGLILNLFTATVGKCRARWFFYCSLVFAIAYLIIIPVGTILGLGFVVYLLIKRREFLVTGKPGNDMT